MLKRLLWTKTGFVSNIIYKTADHCNSTKQAGSKYEKSYQYVYKSKTLCFLCTHYSAQGTAQQLYYEQEGIDRGLKVLWPTCSKNLKKLNWEVFTIKIFKVAIYVNRIQNLTIVHFLAFSRPFWWDFSHFWQVYCDSRVPWLNRKWNCLNRKWNYSDLSGRLPLSNRWF